MRKHATREAPLPNPDTSIERTYGLIVEAAPYAAIVVDETGQIRFVNARTERLFGYSRQELVGLPSEVLVPERLRQLHPGGSPLLEARRQRSGTGLDLCGRRQDGSEFPIEIELSSLEAAPAAWSLITVLDMSGRRRADRRFRLALESAPSGMVMVDSAGRIALVNSQTEKIFGYCREELLGQPVELLVPERFRGKHPHERAGFFAGADSRPMGAGREVYGRRKDGTEFPVEIGLNQIETEEGRFALSAIVDITERKRLERELHGKVEELAAADRRKDEFLAMLGHELRNPLAPMRNALQVMKSAGIDPAIQAQMREIVERQVDSLVRLVDDLLDVGRIVSGRIELRKGPLDLASAVARGVETARPVLDARGHELVLSLPGEPVIVDADLVRLSQVVANLVTNAAKYTPRPDRIWLGVERDGADALIRVRDRGAGIAPELLPRIFDLFVQGAPSLGRSQGGLGLGLTLVKRLVEMHGGSVAASSPGLGEGSEFVVRLPQSALRAASSGPVADPASRIAVGPRRRVLVVDDNVDAAESVAAILRLSGHEARCVHDGHSALEAAESYVPDAVVLDIGLPDMPGYEVARQLRARPRFRHTPLVAVTGYGQEADRMRSRDAGIDEHLTKPVDPAALHAFIAGSGLRW